MEETRQQKPTLQVRGVYNRGKIFMMHVVQGTQTRRDVDAIMAEALSQIACAKENPRAARRNGQEQKVIEMLMPISAPCHGTPRAAFEIAIIHYKRGISALSKWNGFKPAEAHDHFSEAVLFMKMAATMPDRRADLIPAKAMNCLAALHEEGIMRDNELVKFNLLTEVRTQNSEPLCLDAADFKSAFALRKIAAEAGLAKAQWGLGFMYSEGQGVDVSLTQAFRWFNKAHDNKAQLSSEQIDLLEGELDAVIAEMKKRSMVGLSEPKRRKASVVSLTEYRCHKKCTP